MIPGFSSQNLSTVLIAYGLISSEYGLAVTAVAMEISSAFFEFLSPMIFKIGNDATSLVIEPAFSVLNEESFRRAVSLVVTGGLIGVVISLPIIFIAERIYPVVYTSLKPLIGWILLLVCAYMVWIERGWRKKFFATAVFLLAGLLGLLVRDSGLVPSDYYLVPIFIGLYGFSSIISERRERDGLVQDITWRDRARYVGIAFVASVFASFISGMKRGQISAIAMQTGGISRSEEVLFLLPMISLAFITLSIFVLGSTGSVRSTLAFDIQEILGGTNTFFSEILLFAAAVAVSASISAAALTFFARPLGSVLSKINMKYLKIFGFSLGLLMIFIFTGIPGMLLGFTAAAIGLLSKRLGTRSTHLMGVLLLPSILSMILR